MLTPAELDAIERDNRRVDAVVSAVTRYVNVVSMASAQDRAGLRYGTPTKAIDAAQDRMRAALLALIRRSDD